MLSNGDPNTVERLGIFARFPEPGRAKTRLIPALGPEGAARLHEEMVRHTLRMTDDLKQTRAVMVEVWLAGGDEDRFLALFGARTYRAQAAGDLGDRMACAFRSMLAETSAALIIGTDCPALDATLLSEALDELGTHDLVLGPATDGGYYLIGLRAPASGLFEEMPWGTDAVCAETLRRAGGLGLRVHQLRMLDDVDEPRDLTVWEKYRSSEGGPAVAMRPSVSVVIPALNEAARIAATIDSARRDDVEVIVADGGSSDSTREIASRMGAQVVLARRGRGAQLNAGAAAARGDHLLFLHADTTLPAGYLQAVQETVAAPGVVLGAFRLRIDRPGLCLRGIEAAVRFRSALLAMPYGDQALFLSSRVFASLGGFAEIPLLEDLDLVRRAKALGRVRIVRQEVLTSGRRWDVAGVVRMSLVNQLCVLGFNAGISPRWLAEWRDRLSSADDPELLDGSGTR